MTNRILRYPPDVTKGAQCLKALARTQNHSQSQLSAILRQVLIRIYQPTNIILFSGVLIMSGQLPRNECLTTLLRGGNGIITLFVEENATEYA
ncbi:MAG: hypothetical protein A2283_14840 [Lentisphaerae bacterium RIFOXYA12_FULL_48_11]|nr:MAG: hypothetical protein A2283_14840 [Lentisphaerae bacterium RIFOXYA12_FULL_48_11]